MDGSRQKRLLSFGPRLAVEPLENRFLLSTSSVLPGVPLYGDFRDHAHAGIIAARIENQDGGVSKLVPTTYSSDDSPVAALTLPRESGSNYYPRAFPVPGMRPAVDDEDEDRFLYGTLSQRAEHLPQSEIAALASSQGPNGATFVAEPGLPPPTRPAMDAPVVKDSQVMAQGPQLGSLAADSSVQLVASPVAPQWTPEVPRALSAPAQQALETAAPAQQHTDACTPSFFDVARDLAPTAGTLLEGLMRPDLDAMERNVNAFFSHLERLGTLWGSTRLTPRAASWLAVITVVAYEVASLRKHRSDDEHLAAAEDVPGVALPTEEKA